MTEPTIFFIYIMSCLYKQNPTKPKKTISFITKKRLFIHSLNDSIIPTRVKLSR